MISISPSEVSDRKGSNFPASADENLDRFYDLEAMSRRLRYALTKTCAHPKISQNLAKGDSESEQSQGIVNLILKENRLQRLTVQVRVDLPSKRIR